MEEVSAEVPASRERPQPASRSGAARRARKKLAQQLSQQATAALAVGQDPVVVSVSDATGVFGEHRESLDSGSARAAATQVNGPAKAPSHCSAHDQGSLPKQSPVVLVPVEALTRSVAVSNVPVSDSAKSVTLTLSPAKQRAPAPDRGARSTRRPPTIAEEADAIDMVTRYAHHPFEISSRKSRHALIIPYHHKRHTAQIEELERILSGWLRRRFAAEACTEWDGQRNSEGRGKAHWRYRRNENACWRIWFLTRVQKRRPWTKFRIGTCLDDVCPTCAWGEGANRICSCMPNPWQGVPSLEPWGTPFSQAFVRCAPRYDVLLMSPPPGLASLNDVSDPPYLPWRRLLQGAYAFALPNSASLYPPDSLGAFITFHRFQNIAWRRWWSMHFMKDPVQQGERSIAAPSVGTEEETALFPPTPLSSPPSTPLRSRSPDHDWRLHRAYEHPRDVSSSFVTPYPVAFVPVPVHLVPAVQNYLAQLQSASTCSGDQGEVPFVPNRGVIHASLG